MTNYDVNRVECKTAKLWGINSTVQKSAQNIEKITNGDYSNNHIVRRLNKLFWQDFVCVGVLDVEVHKRQAN